MNSLVLDCHPPLLNRKLGKVTRKHYTGLKVYNSPQTPAERKHNKEVESLAQDLISELRTRAIKEAFLTPMEKEYERKREARSITVSSFLHKTAKTSQHLTAVKYWDTFNKELTFNQLTYGVLENFIEYLYHAPTYKINHPLSHNTVVNYTSDIFFLLHKAFRLGLMDSDLSRQVERPTPEKKEHRAATKEELAKLEASPCIDPVVKDAFLFAVYCGGIRIGDLSRLTWANIRGEYLTYIASKTGKETTMRLTSMARERLVQRHETMLFPGIDTSQKVRNILKGWLFSNGVQGERIGWHTARYTFTSILRNSGASLVDLQEVLNHSDPMITEGYIRENKIKSADRVASVIEKLWK